VTQTLLSFEQSPPLSVPAPYFVAAPLFAGAAGLMLFFDPSLFQSRWLPGTLALTHLITLGFFALVMLGAFQQLLPVLAGAEVPRARASAWGLFCAIAAGTAALAHGLATGNPTSLLVAIGSLGIGFAAFATLAAWALFRSPSRHPTIRAMGAAVAALVVTAGLGLALAWGHTGAGVPRQWTDLHLAWGAVGWIALLVMGVAWQVVPMFQLTPDYPRALVRATVPGLAAALLLFSALTGAEGEPARWPGLPVALMLAWFALVTLALQQARRRRLPDVTVHFWRLAMGALLAAVMVWAGAAAFGAATPALLLGVLFLTGFGISAVSGMLYKIVPFLVWLHLNNLKFATGAAFTVPTMKQVIPEVRARWQFRAHLFALCLMVGAALDPSEIMTRIASAGFMVSAALLGFNLWSALALYGRLRRQPAAGAEAIGT
jgi:hypothetical protein